MGMVRFNVPEEFVGVLKKLEESTTPERVILALKWATENPERARDVAKRYRKLKSTGKKCFEWEICAGRHPDYAIEWAEQRQGEVSRERSLLGKALVASQKGGYNFRMPNGVECTMKYRDGDYEFTFKAGGAEVTVLRSGGQYLNDMLKRLIEDGCVDTYRIGAVVYKGKAYPPWSKQAQAILKAIEENVTPEVVATADL